eukprot:7244651-Alexandrium_andersonii.AAC.1
MPAPLARCAVQRHTSVAPSNWVVLGAECGASRIMRPHGHAVVAGPRLMSPPRPHAPALLAVVRPLALRTAMSHVVFVILP